MKWYRCVRTGQGCAVEVTSEDHHGGYYALLPRLDLYSGPWPHFGYGCACVDSQLLALSLLADALDDDDLALRSCCGVAFALLNQLRGESWTLTQEEIIRAFHADEARRGVTRRVCKRGLRRGL